MSHTSPTRLLIGLMATAGAFGVAAMMAAATAPSAHADDFTEILDDVQVLTAAGQSDFGGAATDFGSGLSGAPEGLVSLFAGLNNDELVPDQLLYGSVEALLSDPITQIGPVTALSPELDLASGLADAESSFESGASYLEAIASALSGGDYLTAASDYIDGTYYAFQLPGELVLSGAIDQLLGSI